MVVSPYWPISYTPLGGFIELTSDDDMKPNRLDPPEVTRHGVLLSRLAMRVANPCSTGTPFMGINGADIPVAAPMHTAAPLPSRVAT